MKSRLKGRVRFWVLSLVSVILVLLWLEMDLRRERNELIYGVGENERELCMQADDDPDLIYSFKPNKCGANSKGYQDDEHSFKKGLNLFRIVIIGDSIAQGQGVKRKDSFGKILETKLNS